MESYVRDLTNERELALHHAVTLATDRFTGGPQADKELLATATSIFRWLTGPVAMFSSIGPVRDQTTGQPTGNPSKGNPMQITNTEEYDITINVADVKDVNIPDDPGTATDDIVWTIDNDDVASLRVSDDSRTCTVVGATQGSGVWTATLGDLFITGAVDVVHSAAAKMSAVEGAARPQATV
jgi:hypothetical protein